MLVTAAGGGCGGHGGGGGGSGGGGSDQEDDAGPDSDALLSSSYLEQVAWSRNVVGRRSISNAAEDGGMPKHAHGSRPI